MRLPQVTEDWRWYPEKSLPRPWERLRTLGHAGDSPVQITPSLAHEGFHSAKQPFSRHSVLDRRRRVGVHQPRRRRRPPVHEHEWGLADWEGALGKAHATLPQGRTRGWLRARWHDHRQRWVAGADEAERQRLNPRSVLPTGEKSHHLWRDAQPSQPTASSPCTTVESPQRRDVLRHDRHKQCLDDSFMVDTSRRLTHG